VITRQPLVALASIFLLALGLRLGWIARTDTEIPLLSDPQYYHATASNIADGRGYTVAVDERGFVAGEGGEATAFWAPGYPLALAPLYAVFGPDVRAARVFNAVVGALMVVPVFFLGRRVAGGGRKPLSAEEGAASGAPTTTLDSSHELGGIVAALLFAVCPALVLWAPALFSEALFTFGVACTLVVALWAGERRSMDAYFFAGLTLAATAFVRSQGMVLVVPVLVLVLGPLVASPIPLARDLRLRLRQTADNRGLSGESVARSGLRAWYHKILHCVQNDSPRMFGAIAGVMVGVAVLVLPWAVRNQQQMGRPYLINDNLGYNLRLAHAPYSTGTSVPPQDLWDERPGISFHERELFFDTEGRKRALAYMREHPGREMELAVKRVGWLLRSDAAPAMWWSESLGRTPVGAGRDLLVLLGDVYWYGLMAVAAASVVVGRRDRLWWALWSAVGVWVGLHLVFAGEPRYHAPLVPVLCVLAASVVGFVVHRRDAEGAEDRMGCG
jgi:hypothetical protein